MEKYLYIALFAPLVGSLFATLFANTPKKLFTGIFTSALLGVSMIASLNLLFHVFTSQEVIHVRMLDWIVIGNIDIPFGFIVDPISA
ncbi:MAG: NADH-quinone oxidoreductase subunit L, partial [Arcobacteraceae bacterium]|nr:NADH-quinone oxidoreductase subunit L [Arcobacteraceae bacterium]